MSAETPPPVSVRRLDAIRERDRRADRWLLDWIDFARPVLAAVAEQDCESFGCTSEEHVSVRGCIPARARGVLGALNEVAP